MIYAILITHWIADFILQSDQMAKGKSTSNHWLTIHVVTYSGIIGIFGIKYALVNGASHWLIDWCTSRFNSYMWRQGKVHEFFIGVGFDQLLHVAILIATIPLATPIWEGLK